MGLLLSEQLPVEGFVFDTALAAYLLEATESDYAPERLSVRFLGGELRGAQAVWSLYPELDKRIRELGMRKLMYDIELPLCRVLAEMEKAGFLVNKMALYGYGESMTGTINALQKSIWVAAGREFNINSPKQLGEVLFDDLQLPSGKRPKPAGAPTRMFSKSFRVSTPSSGIFSNTALSRSSNLPMPMVF